MLFKGGEIVATTFVMGGILLMTGAIGGCNSSAARPKPVPIKGQVKTADGAPLGGVRLVLTPEDSKDVLATAGFDLDAEGRFAGEALPGSYSYYFVPVTVERDGDTGKPVDKDEAKKLADSEEFLKKLVPAAYRKPNDAGADDKVKVTAGADLTLVVSKS